MNILSKNTFAVILSGILCLGTLTSVLAQKQQKPTVSAIDKRRAEAQSIQFRRIHSKFEPKLIPSVNNNVTSLKKTRLSMFEIEPTILSNGKQGKLLTFNVIPSVTSPYKTTVVNGKTVSFLSPCALKNNNIIIDLTEQD